MDISKLEVANVSGNLRVTLSTTLKKLDIWKLDKRVNFIIQYICIFSLILLHVHTHTQTYKVTKETIKYGIKLVLQKVLMSGEETAVTL